MPSAANVKIEKQIGAAADNAAALADAANSSPLRQAITIIEHKIRNLEKRKSKLESYRDLQRSGKDLNQDQKTAVAKYDEVVQTLEFARDLCKQFLGIAVVSEKEEKKKARKEAIARSQAELTKVREVLLVQDALTNMGQDTIRDDFLNGRNGAAALTQIDLKLLDDLYTVVTPKHEAGDPTSFMPQVQAAAEHLLAVVDGKSKEVFGANYGQIKEVIGKIHESGYLDQAVEPYVEECMMPVDGVGEQPANMIVNQIEPIPVQALESMTIESRQQQMPPIVEAQQVPQQQQPPPMEAPVLVQPPVPEQIYYQQPPPPQPRPITEVLGAGSFFFLQDSELDTPPEQIPSQTFTNQTYVAAPPPPIPMPPHFQQFPNGPQPQPVQQQAPPPQQQQQQQVVAQQQQQQQPPQQAPTPAIPPPQANNGIGDHLPDSHEEVARQRGGRHPPTQRSNNTTHHQQQPFFANNNGYNNRPNRNRNNGPRPNNRQNNQ